jgi:hypothetical protein
MHFGAIVLIPQETDLAEDALMDAIEFLLEPYCAELEGPERKEYLSTETIEHLTRQFFWVQPKTLARLAAKLRKRWGLHCGVDAGGLYHFTNLNPNSMYDYWTVVGLEGHVEDHVWRVPEMPRDLSPSAVVTPDGQWHETGIEKWAWDITKAEEQAIRQRVYALVDQYPNHLAVLIDCHI